MFLQLIYFSIMLNSSIGIGLIVSFTYNCLTNLLFCIYFEFDIILLYFFISSIFLYNIDSEELPDKTLFISVRDGLIFS